MGSSHRAPSLEAHWKAETTWSLISLRYCTPTVLSTNTFGPDVSGPKHQILRAKLTSQPKLSASARPRSLGSWVEVISPLSMARDRSSPIGTAFMNRRLCLFGDLDRHMRSDSSVTVSRKDTTGSPLMIGVPFMKSSSRSLRQISRWSSPAPATMCSPDSLVLQTTMGSDLDRRLRPSTSLGRSAGFLGRTDTSTTGDTLYFMTLMLWAISWVEMVPVLRM